MNAFQHYIADIQRFPMCLYESTSAEISRQTHVKAERRETVFLALGESKLRASELVTITGLTQGQVEYVLSALEKAGKVTTTPQAPGRPKVWVRK